MSPFYLEQLPSPALEAVFGSLTYAETATACCVSRAWNRALCTQFRSLWSTLVFDSRRLGVPLSAEAVRAVASKARDELRSVTFPDPHATLLYGDSGEAGSAAPVVLGLCATAPTLTHVGVPEADLGIVRDMLEASASLTRLDVACLFVRPEEVARGHATEVLTHPALRVRKLEVRTEDVSTTAAAILQSVVAAMQMQTVWLEAVSVLWGFSIGDPYQMVMDRCSLQDEAGAAFVAAVAACPRLKEAHVPELLTADAYGELVKALVAHGDLGAATVTVVLKDTGHYLDAVLAHLLPAGLGNLRLTPGKLMLPAHDVPADVFAARLGRQPEAPALRHLTITGCDFGAPYHAANVWPALTTCESLSSLVVCGATAELLALMACVDLPAGLASLTLSGVNEAGNRPRSAFDSDVMTLRLAAVLRKAQHVASLTFSNFVWGRPEFCALADHLRSSKCQTRRLVITDITQFLNIKNNVWNLLACALWRNNSVEELTIRPVTDEVGLALADALRGARFLRELTLGVNLCDAVWFDALKHISEEGMTALVEGFLCNDSLQSLNFLVSSTDRLTHLSQLRARMKRAVYTRACKEYGLSTDQVNVTWVGE